jgi:hypothetical protein
MRSWGFLVVVLVVLVLGVCCCVSGSALGLGSDRVYEMVSPPFKGGYGANAIERVSSDGDGVVFNSLGAFAGSPSSLTGTGNAYLARRGGLEWSTIPLVPPAAIAPQAGLVAVSPNLDSVLYRVKVGPNEGVATLFGENEFLVHRTDMPDTATNWELVGMVLKGPYEQRFDINFQDSSADLSHIVFASDPVPLLAKAEGTSGQLYELVGGSMPVLRLVGVNNKGGVISALCPVILGSHSNRISPLNPISANGGEVFFSTNVVPGSSACEDDHSDPKQLFVRVSGSRTLEVSRPLDTAEPFGGCVGEVGGVAGEVPCKGAGGRASAEFDGASSDGSVVFFTTAAQLVGEDRDSGNDLYMARIGCPGGVQECESDPGRKEVLSLVQVSHDPTGGEASVQGVVSVAPDGSHVYFVARGDLSSPVEREVLVGEGRAVPQAGADNLYAYDSMTENVSFVTDLCSGPGLSGEVVDGACPAGLGEYLGARNDMGLWLLRTHESQTTDDGRFLVFSSYGRLVASDGDSARDVYRFDAGTGVLARVSLGEDGADANGNGEFDAGISGELDQRAVSNDGSRVVFTSAEPLSERAVNGLSNVYEWDGGSGEGEGRVSLVSSGSANESVTRTVISSGGGDLFFVTSQGLVPQDTDGAVDVYDARLDGGFPQAPAEGRPCEGDACQGPLTNPAPLLVAGSVSQAPGGNFGHSVKPVIKKKVRREKKAKGSKGKVRRRRVGRSVGGRGQ